MPSMVVISEDAEHQTWAELVSYDIIWFVLGLMLLMQVKSEPNVFQMFSTESLAMTPPCPATLIQCSAETMQRRLLSIITQYF